jgi:hypothetical protein
MPILLFANRPAVKRRASHADRVARPARQVEGAHTGLDLKRLDKGYGSGVDCPPSK